MNLTESIKIVTATNERLFRCVTAEQVNGVFEGLNIADPADKVGLLHLAMGIKNSCQTPDGLTPEQEYEDELKFFIEGSWRLLI
jgi:hypothetical protein